MGYEPYLYTVMTLTWDLDQDTHSLVRKYLDVFINQRKISKEVREFVNKFCPKGKSFCSHEHNPLRNGLPNRILLLGNGDIVGVPTVGGWRSTIIDRIHREKYYLFGIKGMHFGWARASRLPLDNPTLSPDNIVPDRISIEFELPTFQNDKQFRKYLETLNKDRGNSWVPQFTDQVYFPTDKPSKHYPSGVKRVPYCLMRFEDL